MDRWNRIADPLGNGVKKTNQSETDEIKNFWGTYELIALISLFGRTTGVPLSDNQKLLKIAKNRGRIIAYRNTR